MRSAAAEALTTSLRDARRFSPHHPELKMASSFWKGIVGVGLFALAHAAFSAAQRKSRRRHVDRDTVVILSNPVPSFVR